MFKVQYNRLAVVVVLCLLLVACGGGNSQGTSGANSDGNTGGANGGQTDPETGLPINPEVRPDGAFIVEGKIDSLNLTPQTSPEFVIRTDNGHTYRIRSQALADTFFDDGEAVTPSALRQGMPARATITYDDAQLIYKSDDLMLIRVVE